MSGLPFESKSTIPFAKEGLAIGIFVLVWIAVSYVRGRRDLPPGPTPIPIFGNALQIPTEKTWLYFKSLSQRYGPVVRLTIAGTEVVVLDNIEDVEELLVKRSGNYSSRQQVVYGAKYRSDNKRLVLLPYGMEMKKQRAAIFQMLNAKVVGGYEQIQEQGSTKLLSDILNNPSKVYINVKWFTAETLMTLVYGKTFSTDGKDLKTLLNILETFVQDIHPSRHAVDTFPVLDYLPNWLAPWRAEALTKYKGDSEFYIRLLNDVKTAMNNGADLECFAVRLWEGVGKLGLDEISMAFVAGSALEAGTDNTAGSILWFIEVMMLYPDVMKKAQAEIDSVLGTQADTAPGFRHFEQLPYCVSLTKEVFRWMPVAPLGGPRQTMKDDEFNGYRIAAGSTIFANVWSIHHNEFNYPEPFAFKPERFLPKDGSVLGPESLNEGHYGFGFGRRTCPGQYLASKSVWIAIVRLLWAFEILPPLDASGKSILPDPNACRNGITAEPAAYDVVLKPRSANHVHTIRTMYADETNV